MDKNKKKFLIALLFFFAGVFIAIGIAFLLEHVKMPLHAYIILVVIMLLAIISGSIVMARVERVTGVYKCSCCGHEFVPSAKGYIFALHAFGTRRLVCPSCKKKNWCQKDYSKQKGC